jgi:hypothetical protein
LATGFERLLDQALRDPRRRLLSLELAPPAPANGEGEGTAAAVGGIRGFRGTAPTRPSSDRG